MRNAKLPPAGKFEPLFWWLGSWEKSRLLPAELLPDSPRPKRLHLSRLIGFALLLPGMLLLGMGLG
jgi:hypothetical protein